MAWQQLKINVESHDAEAVGDLLSENDAQAVTFVDAKDTPMYEPKPGEVLLWPDTQVIGLFDADNDLQNLIGLVRKSFNDEIEIVLDQLEDKDWEREWMDTFHPMRFGERVWICPSWCDVPEPSAVNILLDPGLAFGTGTHPTTSLCLKWLDASDMKNKIVVDFGCGSGILAIASLKLGAKKVIAIDIDPQALLATKENALRNGVEKNLEVYLPEDQPTLEADIVLANILAAPLKELCDVISDYCKVGGKLLMSGILEEQSDSVEAHYNAQFTFDSPIIDGEWARLSATKFSN
jgi:ribosomal protein L11 methyltransferase